MATPGETPRILDIDWLMLVTRSVDDPALQVFLCPLFFFLLESDDVNL